jgi:hypothetical protein
VPHYSITDQLLCCPALPHADALTGEDGAEIDLLAIEADAPARGDGPVVEWVIELRQASVGRVEGAYRSAGYPLISTCMRSTSF